jgi:hypothetical protein
MAQCQDPMNHYSNEPNEYLCGIFSSKKKAEKALKESKKETSSMVTYYIEKQEIL